MLADFGADVIKVEEPQQGDYSRAMPPYASGDMGLYYLAVNRNKRSLTLNLKSKRGRALFLELLEHADVLLESFRPGVLERLGLGYEQLKTRYPPDLLRH
jgi:crotonobetainyl-CoA:carnitine CoA-transferase CaiB-like acyl-CoA transferase